MYYNNVLISALIKTNIDVSYILCILYICKICTFEVYSVMKCHHQHSQDTAHVELLSLFFTS